MNLFLRPLTDPNGVTWSIVISILILLSGVAYYIYTIMSMAFKELEDDANQSEGCGSGSDASSLVSQDRGCGEGSEGTQGEGSQS